MAVSSLTILKGFHPLKDAVFASLAQIAHDAHGSDAIWLRTIGLRGTEFPETAERVDVAMKRAKRQPKGLGRSIKQGLIKRQYNWARAHFEQNGGIAVCWNGLTGSRRAYMEAARDAGAGRLFAELAPFPGYVTLDSTGVNAESSVPRTKAGLGDVGLSGARRAEMAKALVARAARTARVDQTQRDLPDEPFLFCPLQVPNDSQIQVFGGWVGSVEGFVGALAQASLKLPDGWHLRVKEHPSSKVSMAGPLEAAVSVAGGRLIVDNGTDTFAQVRASRGVITVNSSIALESFLLGKAVVVTGQAYFAEEGLVTPAGSQARLNAICGDPDVLAFDDDHRAAILGYLLDRYYVPVTGKGASTRLDRDRTLEKLAQAEASDVVV
ncbi:capsular biosynthesis protein [Shimia ponticola]|uniref:capsular polysaccharide export protein, LipB/KpsS family n=1 Tax=Shimia ponticola TaxID=2582893 RepID=UPI0011BE6335|nr:capsular biosynthesis protein [Shimia ponticola]